MTRMAAALWERVGQATTYHDLAWADNLLGPGGRDQLWTHLQAAGVLRESQISPRSLAAFLGNLGTEEQVKLLWTLPPGLPQAPVSYAEGLNEVIQGAREELLLMSPFIASSGVQAMKQNLLDALHRGVHVKLIGHDLQDLASAQSQAIETLRKDAERSRMRFTAYSANHQSRLIHAKLAIADRERVVLGSANITGHGLNLNFEVGVILGTPHARRVADVYEQLLQTELVQHIFTTLKAT